MLRIYVHPTCMSSYRVIGEISARDLLDRVQLIDVSSVAAAGVLDGEIWSVPWLTLDGEPVATDPIDPQEAIDIVENGRAAVPADAGSAFMAAVMSSLYAASLVYLHGSLRPVASLRFASAALRSRLGGPEPAQSLQDILSSEDLLLDTYREKLVKVLATGLVRTLWWADGGRPEGPPEERQVAMWLLAAASMGRAGLPRRPQERAGAARPIVEYLRENFERISERVDKEQSTIMGDGDYWDLVRSRVRSGP